MSWVNLMTPVTLILGMTSKGEGVAAKRKQLGQNGLVMNQEIAACERWGKAEILARADRLADRAIAICRRRGVPFAARVDGTGTPFLRRQEVTFADPPWDPAP
ncbi:hypothetical protein AB0L53_30485 [Nonomuraea sp. NPDC052129]|uniref:hypothetical protein n=1 Tax=Nonomuraea sp. NPDC052129 TaxID=3154651 RepID=UPI003432DF2A